MQLARRRIVVASLLLLPCSRVHSCTRIASISQVNKQKHQQLHFVIALAWAMQLARWRIVVASRLLLPCSAVHSCTRIASISQVKKKTIRRKHQQLQFVIALAWAMQLARRRIVVASRRCSGVNNGDASARLILILMPRIPPPMKTPARQVRVTRLTALRQAALRRYVHRELWPRRRPRTRLNATCLCPAHGWLGCVLPPHRQQMWPRRPPCRCRRS